MQYTFSNNDKVYTKTLGWVSRINTSSAPNQGIHTKNRGNNSILPTEGSMPMKSGSADNDASFAMGRKDFVKTVLSSSPMTMNNTDQSSYLARRKAIATGKIIRSAPISFSSKDKNTVNSSLRKCRNGGCVVPKNVIFSRMRKDQENGIVPEPEPEPEVDPFQFPTSLGATYQNGDNIIFNTFGSGFDTELGLYDESGNLVSSNDDGSGGQPGESKIEITLNSVGKYYLVVGSYDIMFSSQDFGITIGHTTIPGTGVLNFGINVDQLSSINFTIDSDKTYKYEVFTFDVEES